MAGSVLGGNTDDYLKSKYGIAYSGGVPVTNNPAPGSQGATNVAKQAVTGLGAAGNPVGQSGGPGSSYSVDTQGNSSYTTTPNLIPQQTAAAKDVNSQQAGFQQESQNSAQQAQSNLAAQQQQAESAFLGQRAGLTDSSFQSRLNAVTNLPGFSLGPNSSSSSTTSGGAGSGGMAPQEQAARDASFAREKDRIGQVSRGAVDSLASLASERGMMGGGFEMSGLSGILGGAQGQLGDVAREQTVQDLSRAGQISDRDFAGNLTKRSQDINYQQALLALLNSGPVY